MEQQTDVEAAREREADAADAIAEPPSLSFPEVFRMIQAGEEVPGLQTLDIKPCNDQPTVSQMPRKSKPWEKWLLPNSKLWTDLQHILLVCKSHKLITFFFKYMILIHSKSGMLNVK